MNVTTIIFIAISVILALILLFRGGSNRSRIHRDKQSLDGLKDSVDRAGARDKELESISDSIERASDNIQTTNGTAKESIDRARAILERAKKRNDNNKD